MGSFVCIFCPSVVAFLVFEKIAKKKYEFKYSLCFYLLYLIIINILTTAICWIFLKVVVRYDDLNMAPMLAIKYVSIALVVGLIVGIVSGWIKQNVRVSIVVKKEKKNGKAKKNS